MKKVIFVFILLNLFLVSGGFAAPTLPQTYIDTTYSAPTGGTCTAANSSEFTACLSSAALNSTIVLNAGTTYRGPFTLPNKTSGSGWIYIVSSNLTSLPAAGTRVGPLNATNMPKVESHYGNALPSILTTDKSHHFRFVGIEFTVATGSPFVYYMVDIGNHAPTDVANVATDITFDRCYFHGDTTVGTKRAMRLDAISGAVIDSYITDIQAEGMSDNQAIWVNATPGPIKIVNNFLQADTENIAFGGSDHGLTNVVCADIEIKRNHFYKPISWYPSKLWYVKNLLEFKLGQRILIEGNTFENTWHDVDQRHALVLTVRNQSGTNTWNFLRDVTVRYNKFINVAGGVNLTGMDGTWPESPSSWAGRFSFNNNLWLINGDYYDSSAFIFQTLPIGIVPGGYPIDVSYDHNTVLITNGGAAAYHFISSGGYDLVDFEFKNNVVSNGTYGFFGQDNGFGKTALDGLCANYIFTKNAIIAGTSGDYSGLGCYFPATTTDVKFVNYAGGNYRLASDSPYKNAGTDSKDLGADIDTLEAAIDGVQTPPTMTTGIGFTVQGGTIR